MDVFSVRWQWFRAIRMTKRWGRSDRIFLGIQAVIYWVQFTLNAELFLV